MSDDRKVNINGVNYSCVHRIENDNVIEEITTDIKGFDTKTNERVFFMTRVISHEIDSDSSDFEKHSYFIFQDDNDLITSSSDLFDGTTRNTVLEDFFDKMLITINTFSR